MRDEARGDRFIVTVPEARKLGYSWRFINEVNKEIGLQKSSEILQFFAECAYTPDREIQQVIGSIKEELINKYLASGINVSFGSFPSLFLVKEENRKKIRSRFKFLTDNTSGMFDAESFGSIVFFEMPTIGRVGAIHHELEHGLGRVFSILGEGKFQASQSGYATASPSGNLKGKVLEEGLVGFNERDFLIHSENEYMVKLRRKTSRVQILSETFDKGLSALWCNFFVTDGQRCSNYIKEVATPDYYQAIKMVDHLIEGVRRKDGDGAVIDFKKELLRGRALPGERFKVINRIDGVFGKGVARTVFSVSFMEKELIEFNEYLGAVIKKTYS